MKTTKILLLCLPAALVVAVRSPAQTPGWTSIEWNFPPTTSGVFEAVEVFPRPQDEGQPDPINPCPLQRAIGVFGFTDPLDPSDPNDDREYFVSCRSDGILLIDATLDRFQNPGGTPGPGIPSTGLVKYISEPTPSVTSPLNAALNGQVSGIPAYCPPLTPYNYTSRNTPNREAVVYRHTSGGQTTFWLYSVSTWRDGLWVVQLVRNAANVLEPSGPILPVSQHPNEFGTWFDPVAVPDNQQPPGSRNLGHNHTIYLDQARGKVYVVDDVYWAVYCFDCLANPGNPPAGGATLIYQTNYNNSGRPHDAQPFGNYLFVTVLSGGAAHQDSTWVYALPLSPTAHLPQEHAIYESGSPTNPSIGAHSVYVDVSTVGMQPTLWTLSEDPSTPDIRGAMVIHDFMQDTTGVFLPRDFVNYVEPTGISLQYAPPQPPSWPLCSPTHHMRGVGRTGFVAQYGDGLGMVDLTTDSVPGAGGTTRMVTLGTFDTTLTDYGEVIATPWYWDFLEIYDGCWDCWPYQDSGLIYASLGRNLIHDSTDERLLTGGVFRALQGHVNRYWHATPFPIGAPGFPQGSERLYPRLISQFGPPLSGRAYDVRDEKAGQYPSTDPSTGDPLVYRWTLFVSTTGPSGVNPASGGAPPSWDPDPGNPMSNSLWFNLVPDPSNSNVQMPNPPTYFPLRNATGDPDFHFPDMGQGGVRWYAQCIVEQLRLVGTPAQEMSTGYWAASRGVWIGVVPVE